MTNRIAGVSPGHRGLPKAFATPKARPGRGDTSQFPSARPQRPLATPSLSGHSVSGSAQATGKLTQRYRQRSRAGAVRLPVLHCCHLPPPLRCCTCPAHARGHGTLPWLLAALCGASFSAVASCATRARCGPRRFSLPPLLILTQQRKQPRASAVWKGMLSSALPCVKGGIAASRFRHAQYILPCVYLKNDRTVS